MLISLTELFCGGGTLTRALSDGLGEFATVVVAGGVELDGRYLQHWSAAHDGATTFRGSIGAYHPAELSVPQRGIRVGAVGIPCTGASRVGKAKHGHSACEKLDGIGYLFLPTLHYIRLHRLDVVVFECVPDFAQSASATATRAALIASGYQLTEWTLDSHDFETATRRKRWVMVASRRGKFVWNYVTRPFSGAIDRLLDPEDERDEVESMSAEQVAADEAYLARKRAEGCNFKRRIVSRSDTAVPCITKYYSRRQPSGSFLRTRSSYRMWRPHEVRALHGFPASFQLPETKALAFEILGQGVCYRPFYELGRELGRWLAAGCPAGAQPARQQTFEFAA